ncbi:MAG: PAS domain-containing sensor histidine kinase [Melioribacteraceae bacterium]|nr:PAS domain-containing sensor histidine kinase [Melioribacteraceae bacterium]MCF8356543.1 PAS domain-containing sensor histidine kinase [Melioribacteraceae bacterium]MCF8395936.1 PAS domain-containing sensor histidine kinase [Melioribacteraceae bacterium]MCF8421015.1 PAS domain-containing sensor histidine kinase [Melioribacteraceae bacterium]
MNIFSFLSSIAFMLYLIYGISAFKKLGNNRQSINFLLLSLSLALYSFGYIFSFSAPDQEWARFWYRIAITGCTLFPIFIVTLSASLSRAKNNLSPVRTFILIIPAIIFFFINYSGYLFADSFRQIDSFSGKIWLPIIDSDNITTLLFVFYIVLYGFGGILIMYFWGRGSNSRRKKRIVNVIIYAAIGTMLLSLFTNYFALLLEIEWSADIAHINLLLSYFAYHYSINKYQFLTPAPNIALTNIMNSAREIIILTNQGNEIVSINKHALKLLGFSKQGIIGTDIHRILQSDKVDPFDTLITLAEKNERLEVSIKTSTGKLLPVSLTAASIRDEFKEVLAKVFIASDITNQVKLNELLLQKEKLISIIAHDLRNPIGTALSVAQELVTDESMDEQEMMVLLQLQQSSLQKSLHLLENLLFWSRIEDADKFYSPSMIDLHLIFESNLKLHSAAIKSKKINIENSIPENFSAYADQNMISTVVRNLINNAIKFSRQNESITLKPFHSNKTHGVSIIDNGIGIEPEELDSIFDMRNSISKDDEGKQGTGLGLIICKEFIEKNKGKIWVESEPGKGSTFSFELPLKSTGYKNN